MSFSLFTIKFQSSLEGQMSSTNIFSILKLMFFHETVMPSSKTAHNRHRAKGNRVTNALNIYRRLLRLNAECIIPRLTTNPYEFLRRAAPARTAASAPWSATAAAARGSGWSAGARRGSRARGASGARAVRRVFARTEGSAPRTPSDNPCAG